MGWGEAKTSDTVGTSGQIELAHHQLDQLGIKPGPLAVRVVEFATTFREIQTTIREIHNGTTGVST
jgi:hypothetical protein